MKGVGTANEPGRHQATHPEADTRRRASRVRRSPARPIEARGAKAQATAERRIGQGGRRLADAFEAVSRMPVLAESRRRLLVAWTARRPPATGRLRTRSSPMPPCRRGAAGGQQRGRKRGWQWGPPGGRDPERRPACRPSRPPSTPTTPSMPPVRGPSGRSAFAATASRPATRPIGSPSSLAWRIATSWRWPHSFTTSGAGCSPSCTASSRSTIAIATPDERIRRERRELGIDHALVGAVLVRRWGMPSSVALAIERHHSPQASGPRRRDPAGGSGRPLRERRAGPAGDDGHRRGSARHRQGPVVALVYEFPHSSAPRRRSSDPCPLSAREIDALRGLAEGKVYKQIAHELRSR